MLNFLDKKYTPASKKNMHAERNNILVKHLGQEAFMYTDDVLVFKTVSRRPVIYT
jgi:hypothetical protein